MSSKFSSGCSVHLWLPRVVGIFAAVLICLFLLGTAGHCQTQVKPNRDIAWPSNCDINNPVYNIFDNACISSSAGSVTGPPTTVPTQAAVWLDDLGHQLNAVPFYIDAAGNTNTPANQTAQSFTASGPPYGWDSLNCNASQPAGFGSSGHWSIWCQIVGGIWQLWAGLNGAAAFQIQAGGGGGGTGTVGSGNAGQVAMYPTTGTSVAGDPNLDDGATTANALTYKGTAGFNSQHGGKFGDNAQGVLNAYEVQSNQPNPATTGSCYICGARGDQIGWRNWGNTGNNSFQLCGLAGGLSGVPDDAPCWLAPTINAGVQQAFIMGLTSPFGTITVGGNAPNLTLDLPTQAAYTVLGNRSVSSARPAAVSTFLSPFAGNPGSWTAQDIWRDTSNSIAKVATSTSAYQRLADYTMFTGWNHWANNYLANLIAVADSGGTVHATGICIGDSTVAGSNTNNVPATNNITSWCEAMATAGTNPKLAEKLQGRFGKRSGGNGYGGAGWIPANVQVTNGGQGVPLNTSTAVTNPGDWTYTGHDGSTTMCPDDTKTYNATVGDIITFTDSLTTAMSGYALGITNGGQFACSVDGGAYGSNISGAGSNNLITGASCQYSGATPGSHTVAMKVTVLGSGSTGVAFCGVHSTNQAATATMEMVKLGSGGARLADFNATPTGNWSTIVTDPAFVAVETGPNEYVLGNRTPAQVAADLHTLKLNVNSVYPNASVIFVLPQRDYRSSGSASTFQDYINAMVEQAHADGVDVIDLYDYTSNATQIAGWNPCPYSTPGACGTGIHMDEQGNTFLANVAYHQMIPSAGTNTGYSWNIQSITANYAVTNADFSTPDHVGNMLITQGAANVTFTLSAFSGTPGGCVLIVNTSNAGLSDTIDPNGNAVDGSSTTFTITRGQWAQICGFSTSYKSIGITSRSAVITASGTITDNAFATGLNSGPQVKTPSATSTLDSSGNASFAGSGTFATTLDTAAGKYHADVNGKVTKNANLTTVGLGSWIPYSVAPSTFTLTAGTTGTTDIPIETPGADTWYVLTAANLVQTNTPASCTGAATVAVQFDYTNADNSVHVTAVNNIFWRAETNTTFSTSSTATPAASTSAPTGAQIWDMMSGPVMIHAKSGNAFKLVWNVVTNTLASCSPFPSFTVTPVISRVIN
jgi:hypothetical protein